MWRRTMAISLALVAIAGAAYLCWPRARQNLLLITLDTTRADRLGCYGYASARTPALDALAASSVLCERAYTVAPLTLPAHASLFTGLYPEEHGLRTNGRGRLDSSLTTLATLLQRQGYDTGAFVASFVLDSKFGLDQGFHQYDDEFSGDEPAHDALHRQRHAEHVIDKALEWLSQKRAKPFCCWVHLYDPHAPYLPHRDLFEDEFADRPYDAEVAYVDQQVDRIVAFLKSRQLESQTLMVVVGDHGEGLGEHAELRHGQTLYNSTMHVPLLFRQPEHLPAGQRIASPVSLVDLSPTILELLGISDSRKITGRSIKPLLLGHPLAATPFFGMTDEPYLESGWSPLRSILDGDWKYIRTTRPELYNLALDPAERHNVLESEPDQAIKMQLQLADFESGLESRVAANVRLSAIERRALASLGYVGSKAEVPASAVAENLPDVKDMLPYEITVEAADRRIHQGDLEAAVTELRQVVGAVPSHTAANWLLAQALSRQGKEDEALNALRAFVTIRPNSPQGHLGLGLTLLKRDLPQAIAELRRALEIDPALMEAHFNLALGLMDTGDFKAALEHFNAVVEIDPRYANAYRWRAFIMANSGRVDNAISDYRSFVRYAPNSPEAHFQLGKYLAQCGAASEAEKHLLRAAELDSQSAELQLALGTFFSACRKYDQAAAHAAKALELKPGFAEAEEVLQSAKQAIKTGSR